MIQCVSKDGRYQTNQRLSRRALATHHTNGVTPESAADQFPQPSKITSDQIRKQMEQRVNLRLVVDGVLNNFAE